MQTYSKKSNAKRAADKQPNTIVEQAADGRWAVVLPPPPPPPPVMIPAAKAPRLPKPAVLTSAGLPVPPDFTANTHKPYRAKLAKLVALVEAGDVLGLEAFAINPTSTSPKALARYRAAALSALSARGAAASTEGKAA